MYEVLARFIQNVLRSTLLHSNKTTKKCIQFLNEIKYIYIAKNQITYFWKKSWYRFFFRLVYIQILQQLNKSHDQYFKHIIVLYILIVQLQSIDVMIVFLNNKPNLYVWLPMSNIEYHNSAMTNILAIICFSLY